MSFHRKDITTACDADADCGTGYYCGGETDPAGVNTGVCFKAQRCVSFTTPNETLVRDITGTCASCTNLDHYEFWTDTDNSKIELRGTLTADAVKTSYERNADGMITKRVENDDDYVATNTNPAAARVTYYKYDNASFPGRVTEERTQSELKPGGTCDASTTTDCQRALYAYTTDGLIDTRQDLGFTYNASGAVVAYSFTRDWDYDTKGRVTLYKGPRAGLDDNVEYTYHAAGSGLSTDYLNEVKRKKNASTYLVTTHNAYNFWGQAERVTDPNSKSVCLTHEGLFGLVAARRQVVNGSQTDCASPGSNDETTSYAYNVRRQLAQTTF
ncbi:MAG: hypothetical protein AABZ01_09575, partial [Gemmatimonadota bacterium]